MIYEFKFPDVGEGVHEGKILQLKVNAGDRVEAGDILAVVETDKVVAEIPSSKNGILQKFGAEEGQIIHVGDTLAFIEIDSTVDLPEEKEENAGVVGELEVADGSSILPSSGEGLLDGSPENVTLVPGRIRALATPVARKMAADLNIDIQSIKGSGPNGRVMKADISRKASKKTLETASVSTPLISKETPAGEQISPQHIPLNTIRKTIAENMERSHAIPVAVIQEFTTIDSLVELRKKYNADHDEGLSFQPFFIKALAQALLKFPAINAHFDAEKQEILRFPSVNMGLAVDTESGLMVPVIENVENKPIIQINTEMKELVAQAKSRTIDLSKLRGGTFSITNYGPFGGVYGKPMILPPQVGIMGFGRIHEAPVVKDGDVVPAWILPVSFAFDHRVVDGAEASMFVTYFLKLLHEPFHLLVSL